MTEQPHIVIREATIDDAAAIARVHVDSWKSTYRGIVPDAVLDGLIHEERTAQRAHQMRTAAPDVFYLVAEASGNVVGFAVAGREREGDPDYAGEMYALYLVPSAQGRGIGRRLFESVAQRLVRQGLPSMLVWVLAENPSRHFYEAMGGEPVREKMITIGKPLREVAYGWTDIRSFGASARVDASV